MYDGPIILILLLINNASSLFSTFILYNIVLPNFVYISFSIYVFVGMESTKKLNLIREICIVLLTMELIRVQIIIASFISIEKNILYIYTVMTDNTSSEYCNIFFCVDNNESPYVTTLMNSIITNASNKQLLNFCIFVDSIDTSKFLENEIEKIKSECKINYNFKCLGEEDANFIKSNMRLIDVSNKYIQNIMNFARLWLPLYFNDCNSGLYLDIDTIVLGDVIEIFKKYNFKSSKFYAVRLHETTHTISGIVKKKNYEFFNSGLYYFDCEYWRDNNLTEKCKDIMIEHKNSENGLFRLGTQPILNILFFEKYVELPSEWNLMGIGSDFSITPSKVKKGKMLHWCGINKPWIDGSKYNKYWKKYNV